ncbi:SURF1 family protein [Raineyella fluvialis]|uniref:SURF1-like protein n=1 Tax=Raineyella fluvialis TaxID=2662261 RepID=A0A5Q2FA91_9ACTN|nr:SURF1 family protein [Raineyella fluvialis]QGF23301.1 SURF1 family protein [Raineyella fluvialis]
MSSDVMARAGLVKTRIQQGALLVVGLVLAAVMIGLGLWQMQVFENQGQSGAVARMEQPPVPLTDVARAGQQITDGYGRTVEFTGTYVPAEQLLIPVDGKPGTFRVLTPLKTDDGTLVPVVRGESAGTTPPAPPAGEVAQRGVLLASDKQVSRPLPSGQIGSVYLPVLVQRWLDPMIAGYVTLPADQAAAQGLQPATPHLPSGRGSVQNFGYALQWWVFAACALGFAIYLATYIGRAADRRRLAELGLITHDEIGPDPDRMS